MKREMTVFFAGFLLLIFGLSGTSWGYRSKPVRYFKRIVGGTSLSIVQAPLSEIKVIPVMSSGGPGTDESFASMARRVDAFAAINGCYFDKHTLKPIGDIATDGRLLAWGGFGAVWGLKEDGGMDFDYLPKWTHKNYSDYEIGVSCIPFLVRDGKVALRNDSDLVRQGFHDRDVFMRMPRAAIGFTRKGDILFITSGSTYMPQFAKAVRALGVDNAIGLDGGASVGLYYKGRTLDSPSRRLTNILAIVHK